jgi:hypothetical protein
MKRLIRKSLSVATVFALSVLLLAIVIGPTLAVEPWAFTAYLPSPTTQSLTAGCALDANNAWAGGGSSTVIRYNGTAWATETIPIAGIFVGGLAAANTSNIWAVGDNLDIFYSDGSAGGNWVTQNSGGTGNFYGACAVDTNNVWAVGGTTTGPYTSILYKWNGTAWSNEAPLGINDQFKAVSACDADHVWALGYDSSNNSHIYFRDATHTWNATAQYTLAGTRLRGIKAIDSTHVWAVGDSGTILFFNGTTWAPHTQSGVITTQGQYMINATSASNVWSAGSGNTILNFDGTTWTLFNTPDPANPNLRTALPASPGAIWITGSGGKIFQGSRTFISSCDPAWGAQTQTLDVNITGVGSNFANGTSVASFSGTGITVNSTTVTNATHATANITIAAGAAPGARDVTVTTGTSRPTKAGAFTVKAMHTLTTNPGAHGTITPAGPVKVVDGEDQAFAITPAPGYHISDVVVDGAHMGAVNTYTFSNVTTDHTVAAIFGNTYPTWYLPEGSTAWGFQSVINIVNPNDQDLNAKVTYMLADGATRQLDVGLPKSSKVILDPALTVGTTDFSTRVECVQGKTIAVDRTMQWDTGAVTGAGATGAGKAIGAHNSIGVYAPSNNWFLPEGSSNWDLETWLLIQNPSDVEASCDVTYMIEGIGPKTINHKVPAHSRASFKMENEIGKADASIQVESNVGVISERALYTHWTAPSGQEMRREGHDSVGATQPAKDFYLAEGSTAWGFMTYVLVQNPNAVTANVTLAFMSTKGPEKYTSFTIPANSRKTVRVNDEYGDNDFSTRVHADRPIVAERAMYWLEDEADGLATHDSIGTSSAHTSWYLPDGNINGGVNGTETFTLVQNPNGEKVDVRISYLNMGGKDNVVFSDTLPANSRKTYNMADKYPGGTASASIVVECLTPGKKIIVERSMYKDARWSGTDTIGGFSD